MLLLCQLCQLIFDLLRQVFGSFRVMVCLQCIKQTLLVWVEWTSRNFVPHGEEKTGNYLIGRSGMRRRNTWILHLHTSHNAPFLSPPLPPKKVVHKHCLQFLLDHCNAQEEIKTKVMENSGWQTRCIMGDVQMVNFQISVDEQSVH